MKIKIDEPYPLLAPIPAAVIAVASERSGDNLITLAWVGVACSEPPCVSIAIRKQARHSYHIIHENPEFTVNIAHRSQVEAVDLCGVLHGDKVDKWSAAGLSREASEFISVPRVKEFPVNLECKVVHSVVLGTHELFIGEVLATHIDEGVFSEGRLDIRAFAPLAYITKVCAYYPIDTEAELGQYGYSKR